ncbi:hypothetical protein E2C01_070780 [Portunus trituberculatus]|uniref:Uncharacterized protein n=1 Tax=Portunus trituberculatus TaxID=210409 RepID=A0A5B7HV35_PORTR|nr:hypothetical protein [Portunus trituberculatus]
MAKCLTLYVVEFEPTRGRLPDPTLTTLSTMPHGGCSFFLHLPLGRVVFVAQEASNSIWQGGL